MKPPPTLLGLSLCDLVIVEEGTHKISLIGTFSTIKAREFPLHRRPFCIFATLTDGLGDGVVELTITEMEAEEEIYRLERSVHFPDRLSEVSLLFRVEECVFPSPGLYTATMLVDGDWLAHRQFRVSQIEESS